MRIRDSLQGKGVGGLGCKEFANSIFQSPGYFFLPHRSNYALLLHSDRTERLT